MFPEGSTQPNERTRRLLEKLGPRCARCRTASPSRATPPPTGPASARPRPPWELSAGRAVSVREILAGAGIPDDRFASVAGKADTEPMFPDNPYLPANRRVT